MSQQQDLLAGILRIWTDDRLALVLAVALLALQVTILLVGYRRTILVVRRATGAIARVAGALHGRSITAEAADRSAPGEIHRALKAAHRLSSQSEHVDREELSDLFLPHRLLPESYNARWDAAAPGVFTAIGILGTFLGLILGFLRVDSSQASDSVAPLLGGMVVAFVNSFVGVLLSVLWTYWSRRARHDFDVSCKMLVQVVLDAVPGSSLGQQSIVLLTEVESKIDALAKAVDRLASNTQEASDRLLANLSKNVGDSFESLINKPFEQVNSSVARFSELVESAAAVHEALFLRLETTVRHVNEGGARFASVLDAATECVGEFATAALQLRESTAAAELVMTRTQGAADQMRAAAVAVSGSVESINDVAQVMSVANAAMTTASTALATNAASFERSGERFEHAGRELQQAVGALRDASAEVVEVTTQALSTQLGDAITTLSESLDNTGRRTIAAYEESASRVVEAVAENMTDLTERLSANLGTLGSQIAEHSDSMGHVIGDIKRQLEIASRTNRESLDQIAKTSPEIIKAQLSEFDRALAKAVDHFSGTLEQWDGKLSNVEEITAELRKLTTRAAARAQLALIEGPADAPSNGVER